LSLLHWKIRYSGEENVLDNERDTMLAILDSLHAAALKGGMQFGASEQLSKIARLSSEHFSAEEALMESTNYPELSAHTTTHRELTATLCDLMDRHHEGDGAPYFQLLRSVLDRFQNHLKQEDRKYALWLNAHGAKLRTQASVALQSRPSSS